MRNSILVSRCCSRTAIFVAAVLGAAGCAREQPKLVQDSTAGALATPKDAVQGPAGMLHVDDGGSGGIPVLFVHSFGGDVSHWAQQLTHLRGERRAVAIDLRGHGASNTPSNGDYSVDAFSKDISAVVDSIGLERFVLVGHSLGGAAALLYAGTHPDRVAGLVMAGTPGSTPPEQSRPVITALESDAYQQTMDDYMKRLLTGAKPEVAQQVHVGYDKLTREQSVAIIRAIFEYDPRTSLNRYRGPVLNITRAEDPDSPTALHKISPTMLRRSMSGTSHWMHMDKPAEFNAILDDFLKEVKPVAAR